MIKRSLKNQRSVMENFLGVESCEHKAGVFQIPTTVLIYAELMCLLSGNIGALITIVSLSFLAIEPP